MCACSLFKSSNRRASSIRARFSAFSKETNFSISNSRSRSLSEVVSRRSFSISLSTKEITDRETKASSLSGEFPISLAFSCSTSVRCPGQCTESRARTFRTRACARIRTTARAVSVSTSTSVASVAGALVCVLRADHQRHDRGEYFSSFLLQPCQKILRQAVAAGCVENIKRNREQDKEDQQESEHSEVRFHEIEHGGFPKNRNEDPQCQNCQCQKCYICSRDHSRSPSTFLNLSTNSKRPLTLCFASKLET